MRAAVAPLSHNVPQSYSCRNHSHHGTSVPSRGAVCKLQCHPVSQRPLGPQHPISWAPQHPPSPQNTISWALQLT